MTGYMPLKLPRLRTSTPLVDSKTGQPSREFVMFWDEHCTLIEDAINGLILIGSQVSDGLGAVSELRADVEELRRFVAAGDVAGILAELENVRRLILPHNPALAWRIEDVLLLVPPAQATTSVESSSSTGSWIPLVDGAEPPGFITDGAGRLILVAYP